MRKGKMWMIKYGSRGGKEEDGDKGRRERDGE